MFYNPWTGTKSKKINLKVVSLRHCKPCFICLKMWKDISMECDMLNPQNNLKM